MAEAAINRSTVPEASGQIDLALGDWRAAVPALRQILHNPLGRVLENRGQLGPAAEAALNCVPLAALALHDDPALQAASAADWIARKSPPEAPT